MPKIPQSVNLAPLEGLHRLHSGKVRDTYALPDHPDHLLFVVSDRISIYDFVLAFPVRQKGEILNALNLFWRTRVVRDFCEHDLAAWGRDIDPFLPEALRGNPDLHRRATVVRKLDLLPVESIVRGYLSGNGWKSYRETGSVAGHKLPQGLVEGSQLPFPIYTPSTKAETGHDVYITADEVAAQHGFIHERKALQLYQLGRAYARQRGVILADTKFEGNDRAYADELFTPDSSRYWDVDAWEKAVRKGKLPPSLDKEYVRSWGKSVGIDKLDPENPEHLKQVEGLIAPDSAIRMTTRIYRYIFWRLTGQKLEEFQRQDMGVETAPSPVRVDLLLGSRSDLDQTRAARDYLAAQGAEFRLNVISCHRNPEELRQYAEQVQPGRPDVIIAGAGMAAQLPGVLKAWLVHFGKADVPVIGVAFKGATEAADEAARLSIEQLPGAWLEVNAAGNAYFGAEGMLEAARAAVEHEFLPRTIEPKPAEYDVK